MNCFQHINTLIVGDCNLVRAYYRKVFIVFMIFISFSLVT